MTKTATACWLWAVVSLTIGLVIALHMQEPRLIKTLRNKPAARRQLQLVAQQLVENSRISGRKEWRQDESDFPDEARKLGLKLVQVSHFGESLVLRVPVDEHRKFIVYSEKTSKLSSTGPPGPNNPVLGNGIVLLYDTDDSGVVTFDMGQLEPAK